MTNLEEQQLETLNQEHLDLAKIVIIGVGGGGNNSVESMMRQNLEGVKFYLANTDLQVLKRFDKEIVIHLGSKSSGGRGLGAGANPEVGRQAAIESEEEIKNAISGADMVIVTAGMGGGTGTGAAPVIAKVAKDMGILTIGIITTPFDFEGPKRANNANDGLENMRESVDSLIMISNNKLLQQFGNIPLTDSFKFADTVLKQTVKTMTDIISIPAMINLDFADVTTVMKDKGNAIIGIGGSRGKDRASRAALAAINSPILESSIVGAKDMIVNITGGSDFSLAESQIVVDTINKEVGGNPNIIFGVAINPGQDKDLYVSVIATGIVGNDEIKIGDLEEDSWQDSHDSMTKIFTNEYPLEDLEIEFNEDEDYPEEDQDDDLPPVIRKK